MKKNNLSNLPIGIFDSGMGGLTVLRCLKELLPQESFIYLGDTARLPYGTKSTETIIKYAFQMANLLNDEHIKFMVVACNTASMAALDHLQKHFSHIPIIGVIQPGAKALVKASLNRQVAVIGTEATIASNVYPDMIKNIDQNMEVTSLACGLFVALAEEGCVNDEVAQAAIKKYLKPIINDRNSIDALLLGCTHFPVLKDTIEKTLGPGVTLVDSAHTTALTVVDELKKHALSNNSAERFIRFFVTDSPERFSRVGNLFYGEDIPNASICFVDANGNKNDCHPTDA